MFTITRTDGKTDWQLLRRIFYVTLVVWVFAVKVANIDPFGLAAAMPVMWVMDVIAIVAIYLFVWHVMWPNRPALKSA